MDLRRSARYFLLLLVAILLIAASLSGCQGRGKTAVSAATKNAASVASPTRLPTQTPAPTRTLAILPPTRTPTPPAAEVTRTPSPTPTATINSPQTMVAKSTADASTKCNKYGDNSWLITASPSWKGGWCDLKGLTGPGVPFYEYRLVYPSAWKVTNFGELTANIYFYTDLKNTELRLYQVYNYNTRKYEGTLEDAPNKAAFCDDKDNCTAVVSPLEKILHKTVSNVGGREVLILDSQDGRYNIRRYFFFVPFKYTSPKSNRLFFMKLYTPDPVTPTNYTGLEKQIEDIIISVKENF